MRKSDLQKHTLHFHAGDFEELRVLYPDVSPTLVIRQLVRKHIEKLQAGSKPIAIEVEI